MNPDIVPRRGRGMYFETGTHSVLGNDTSVQICVLPFICLTIGILPNHSDS